MHTGILLLFMLLCRNCQGSGLTQKIIINNILFVENLPATVPNALYEWHHGQCLTQPQESKLKTAEAIQLLLGK